MSGNNTRFIKGVPKLHLIISTGFFTGFCPGAPGTAGALLALVMWYVLYLLLNPVALLITTAALIVVTTVVGIWTSSVMEKYWGPDPRTVNIDEFVGTWIPMLAAQCVTPEHDYTWLLALVGFAAFRLIDIFKPLGCRKVEKDFPGGWGVMFDDVLAGLYALVIVFVLNQLLS